MRYYDFLHSLEALLLQSREQRVEGLKMSKEGSQEWRFHLEMYEKESQLKKALGQSKQKLLFYMTYVKDNQVEWTRLRAEVS
mmetsp:Transcript_24544/g.38072  ORF Transcript_24544/g.38072 Transcript_24544/m.38072 type:complete len:82 (-) Transcript_24544:19-264(-)